MNIKEIITEEVVDEYAVMPNFDPSRTIRRGDEEKESTIEVKNTPLSDRFEVRYDDSLVPYHTYYFYDKETGESPGKCVGTFAIEMQDRKFDKVLKPGVEAVIPHMSLLPQVQGQDIAKKAYTAFLRGGNWVFVTSRHTQAAARLWDSLAVGDIINVYVSDETEKRIKKLRGYHDLRMIGPKDRFL
jgi:hypothetical protein